MQRGVIDALIAGCAAPSSIVKNNTDDENVAIITKVFFIYKGQIFTQNEN